MTVASFGQLHLTTIESCIKSSWSVKNWELLISLFLVTCQNTIVVKLGLLSNSFENAVVYAPKCD